MIPPEGPASGRCAPGADAMHSTVELLTQARAGDRTAVELLFERCLPPLRRWARGRLPSYARGMAETQDLVQEVVLRTLRNLSGFQARGQGALQAYLRQALANRIRDEIRHTIRHPTLLELSDAQPDESPSPLERAIGREGLARYERALASVSEADREAIVARIELQQSYEEIAVALGRPTANAARVAVTRALSRLVEQMSRAR
jgi:RNA polymerase sigma factor (sigma-70 family)